MKPNNRNRNNNRGNNRNYNNNNNPSRSRNLGGGIPSKNQVLESSGPSGKIRGNLMQLIEKYLSAGKDAVSQDDIVLAENCYQHADHYNRLFNLATANEQNRRQEYQAQQSPSPQIAESTVAEPAVQIKAEEPPPLHELPFLKQEVAESAADGNEDEDAPLIKSRRGRKPKQEEVPS